MPWWYTKPAIIAWLLMPISAVFRLLVAVRRLAYRRGWLRVQRLPVPVIVIGNLTVGGTGKTPLTIALVQLLRARGYHPGVVTRGYGGQRHAAPCEVSAAADPYQVGDEPVLLARHCPVVVDVRRPRGARHLMALGCDVILADDGLQHYALGRDIEVLVVDGERRFGNGCCLPAGPLREPPARMQTGDFIVANGQGLPGEYTMQLHTPRVVAVYDPQQAQPLAAWRGQSVHAVAGIGHPERFFRRLRAAGLQVTAHAFPDHHHFRRSDLQFPDTQSILMTEKDAVKCRSFATGRYWMVPVEVELPDALVTALAARLSQIVQLLPQREAYGQEIT